jgi:phage baseplate assembly protein W
MAEDFGASKEFLGAGVAFPLALDAQKQIAMNGLEDHVQQSILLIMRTAKGERVMRPDFGADLDKLAFEPLSPATIARVQHQVREALVRFEPRIDVLHVTATVHPTEKAGLLIHVEYRVRQTDTVFNLVYPFYLERGEG